MNRILTAKLEDSDSAKEIQKIAEEFPVEEHGRVWEAFRAVDDGDYEKASDLCSELLNWLPSQGIRKLQGICHFMKGQMRGARLFFSELVRDYPEDEESRIYKGLAEHALGDFEEAVKTLEPIYPLREYHPFYYSAYGDSLHLLGRTKQSREAFREEAAYFEKTGRIVAAETLNGAFGSLLYLDISLGNGKYPEDVRLYYDFLDQVEMTDAMQEELAGNIVYLCNLMSNKWYRPLFLELITHIEDRGFLTGAKTRETLESAFTSWESYAYHEDRKIDALLEQYLSSSHQRTYMPEEPELKEERDRIIATALTYDWYMCQYLPEHPEAEEYVKDTYPHTYVNCRDFFEKIKADAAGTARKALDELQPYAARGSREEIEESLHAAYARAVGVKKEPVYVYDGMETYRRMQPKVGRNDPCPCGSGKKYKKCCGR